MNVLFQQTSMACVYLASKIEESQKRLREVIGVFHHLKQLNRIREKLSAYKKWVFENIFQSFNPLMV